MTNTLDAGAASYSITETHDGPADLQITEHVITNADQGAVYSWQAAADCYPSETNANRTYIQTQPCPTALENHLTTTHDGQITADVIWDPGASWRTAVEPLLQLEDGSFAGTVSTDTGNALVVFDNAGQVAWSAPNADPVVATLGGGLIASSAAGNYTLDSGGNAVDQTDGMPIQSWLGNTYLIGSIQQVISSQPELALSFYGQRGGNASGTGTSVYPVTQEVRKRVADTARGYVGSQNWLDEPGLNKCNLFVHDVLKQAGTTPPSSDKTGMRTRIQYYLGLVDSPYWPAQAGDWANPSATLGAWKMVPAPTHSALSAPDTSISGDVIAEAIQYSDATGHVGIIVGPAQTTSADSTTNCDFSGLPPGVITISDYGFRADDYLRICHLPGQDVALTHGQKRHAVVKRFMGQ